MDRPLGYAVGNTVEVVEAIKTLQGNGPEDLTELCIALAAHMLVLSEKGDYATCEEMAKKSIADGSALATLYAMVEAQGGDPAYIRDPEKFKGASFTKMVTAPNTGYVHHVDAEGYGTAALLLGAGRNTKEDTIDHAAGLMIHANTGDYVKAGDPIATLYTEREETLVAAEARLLSATFFSEEAPAARPLIFDIICE